MIGLGPEIQYIQYIKTPWKVVIGTGLEINYIKSPWKVVIGTGL